MPSLETDVIDGLLRYLDISLHDKPSRKLLNSVLALQPVGGAHDQNPEITKSISYERAYRFESSTA